MAVQFNGSTEYGDVADHADLDFGTGDFSVVVYLKTTTAAKSEVVNKRVANGNFWFIRIHDDGYTDKVYYNFDALSIWGTNDPADGAWHQLALVRDGDNGYGYFDAVLDASGAGIAASSYSNAADLRLAVDEAANFFLAGTLCEVRIYKGKALTAAELLADLNLRVAAATELKCYLRMEEQSGSTAYDLSGNAHPATLYNTPSWVEGHPILLAGGPLIV